MTPSSPVEARATPASLSPPLKLAWIYPKVIPDPIACGDGVLVKTLSPYGLARLTAAGTKVWGRKGGVYNAGLALSDGVILGLVDDERRRVRELCIVDPATGLDVRREPTPFGISHVISRGEFIGVRKGERDSDSVVATVLGKVCLTARGLQVDWEIASHDLRAKLGAADAWDANVACIEGRLLLARGARFVCLDAGTGHEIWSASTMSIGGGATGGRDPIVVNDVVIVNGIAGTIAFDWRTGQEAWTSPVCGSRSASENHLHFLRPASYGGTYTVVDSATGRVVLDVPLLAAMRKQCGAGSSRKWRGTTLFTRPAVTATHAFFGDDDGRLWAVKRDGGEVVWVHRPTDIAGYLSSVPQIIDGRLYITSFSMDAKKPQALYCYAAE